MKIGSLGDIVFEVSDKTVNTFNGLKLSGGANIATHARHNQTALSEFTGAASENISFTVKTYRQLGVEPSDEIELIRNYTRTGTALKFVLGKKVIGGKWLIKTWNATQDDFDKNGIPTSAIINLTLTEAGE